MAKPVSKSLYVDQPCDRCGSPKITSKTWQEEVQNSMGTSFIEVSQTICTNPTCQAEFEKNRKEEVAKIDARKLAKEEQDKIRKDNIAKTILERKEVKKAIEESKS